MTYIKGIFILLFLSLIFNIKGQQIIGTNLVQNPSFEEYYSCPCNEGELFKCKYWWGFSTDFFNICSPFLCPASYPSNFAGFQYAHSGTAYAGAIIYDYTWRRYRESIKTKLNDSLNINKRYCANFYISLSEFSYTRIPNSYILLDTIGMLFTKDSIKDTVLPIINSGIKVQNDIFNIDTVSWFKMSFNFLSNGGEKYLAIGNFEDIINWPIGTQGLTYVYIDDVSVCECSFKFNLGNDTTLCDGETLQLKVNMPNATYIWQDGSTDSTYKVTQVGIYWVKAYFADYNITTYDTINIMYKDCEDTLVIPNIFTPNGDNINDYFVIKNIEYWNINLQVFNRWGVIVYEDNNYKNNWDGKYKGNPLADGTYFYIIKTKGKDSGNEKEYKGSLMIMR